jgi:hypothetical protein
MTVLRVDPWDPEYGASVEDDDDPDRPAPFVEFVEPGEWAAVVCEPSADEPCWAFIDGIRRVDLRLFAEDGDVIAPALAATYGVGVAWSGTKCVVDDVRIRRALILGRGLDHSALALTIGNHLLEYVTHTSQARTPKETLQQLQNRMREEEANLAAQIAARGEADLIIQDGPLSYTGSATPTIGMIKRQSRPYLDTERQRLLPLLEPGWRTPIFRFESRQLPRFSWYARIATRRKIDGTLAGLLRLEVHENQGLDTAVRIANRTTSLLPRFAAPLWRDSRAPQNLYPVGQLETVLRNRLGDPELVRRQVERALWEAAA